MSDIETPDVAHNPEMSDIPAGLPEPSIIILTVATRSDGQSSVNYTVPPEEAVRILTRVVDYIKEDVERASLRASVEETEYRREQDEGPDE